jgi:hypothetical protein
MEPLYTCSCGNQTWVILDNAVRCTACNERYEVVLTPVQEFNRMVAEEIQELEEA